MFGRDRDKIRIIGDIIEPIGVTWETETGKMWEREDDNQGQQFASGGDNK